MAVTVHALQHHGNLLHNKLYAWRTHSPLRHRCCKPTSATHTVLEAWTRCLPVMRSSLHYVRLP